MSDPSLRGPKASYLLTVEEVAERMSKNPGQVRACIHSGELPAVKIGSRWRVMREDLEAVLGNGGPLPGEGAPSSKGRTA